MLSLHCNGVSAYQTTQKRRDVLPSSPLLQRTTSRRDVLNAIFVTTAALPQTAHAGEVGARITKAVTTSDLGISVRTSVVKGAQIMDQVDGQWERFSDRFALGAERRKQDLLPAPKAIPEPQPLDVATARSILRMTDDVFVTITQLPLQTQIDKVENLVRASFERSGLTQDAEQFNFATYVHYKAYTDLLLQHKIAFGPFLRTFEAQVGQRLLQLLGIETRPSQQRPQQLASCLEALRAFGDRLQATGLVALVDISPIDPIVLEDWLEDMGDLSFNIALDGDITQNAQILIQEQGYRFYPNYGRYGVAALLTAQRMGSKVIVEDYYMDTNYNSDPDKFEVREVLLNIVVESD